MLYGRLDNLRDRASGRLSNVLLETGGTPAARSERDSFVEMYSQRITQLDAAENGLCFGRLDLAEGERRYIGRIGILDDASDYEALLVDWRAPAARPFYIATAFTPEGVLRPAGGLARARGPPVLYRHRFHARGRAAAPAYPDPPAQGDRGG